MLTYDDGPHPEHTPAVLDALAAGGAHATFFVLLSQARRYPELIRRMAAEGHDVALHGVDHTRPSALSTGRLVRDVLSARTELSRLAEQRVRFYRPAYGAIRLGQLALLRATGLEVVGWSAWAQDWEDRPVEELADLGSRGLFPGSILLLHDSNAEADAGAAEPPRFDRGELTSRLVAQARRRHLRLLSVSEACGTHDAGRAAWFESGRAVGAG